MDVINNFFVYIFYNKDWDVPFYVGKGCNGRSKDMKRRNSHIKAILEHYNCESQIIKENLTENESFEFETFYKNYFKNLGYPIIDYEVEKAEICKLRQREGIEKAKREGKYKGRKPITVPDFDTYYQHYLNKTKTKRQIAKELNISRPTLDKIIRDYVA